jgi:lysophospholipase L1-like esterase
MKEIKIAALGDSITKGVVLNKENNYSILEESFIGLLRERVGIEIDNYGKFGCTISYAHHFVDRHPEEIASAKYTLLEYGGNDADFRWAEVAAHPFDEHEPNTPLPVFTETLRRMIETLRAHHVKPVLSTLPPISSERYLDWITRDGLSKENILLWLGDANAIYRYQEKYSLAIERLAAETGCFLVDLRSAFLEKRALLPYLCADGIHPNDAGQRLIHEVLSNAADTNPALV